MKNYFQITLTAVTVLAAISAVYVAVFPEALGRWQARVDVGYFDIMSNNELTGIVYDE